MLHLLLSEQATRIAVADDLATASAAYFVARGAYYAELDGDGVTETDRYAWEVVMDFFKVACDELATPVEPLVVFA